MINFQNSKGIPSIECERIWLKREPTKHSNSTLLKLLQFCERILSNLFEWFRVIWKFRPFYFGSTFFCLWGDKNWKDLINLSDFHKKSRKKLKKLIQTCYNLKILTLLLNKIFVLSLFLCLMYYLLVVLWHLLGFGQKSTKYEWNENRL